MSGAPLVRGARVAVLVSLAAMLSACSALPSFLGGGPDRPKPAELAPNPALIGVRQAWSARIGDVGFPLSVQVNDTRVTVAAGDGTVAAFDAATGRELWRAAVGAPLAAGVGSDGTRSAVVTRENQLVGLADGKVAWREPLQAQSYTPPLVAGGRVFVLAADRSVTAHDGATGRRLWSLQRPGEPLVLRQAGVLLPVGNTLLVGQGGRLAALDPDTGNVRWEAPIGTSRGTNDVERLVDLVGPASRVGESVCARAFQAAVGCVDVQRGSVRWTRRASGAEGLAGDERQVFGTEADGRVQAWNRADGDPAWNTDLLKWRGLTAPLLIGRSVAVGDSTGLVHLLSREDGSLLNRLSTDGSAIAAAPVLAGNTLVVVTRSGGVFGFVPN
ncbi:outer membrane protein assembly factor BamB [Ramlibacter rhizophilus]|uniref:Outer membrane protein assembly factor BamB n=1 Tax=Ramlibacter rhizophilus TaxID=1781167 RepID=A0A4Z0BV76_9BURK|nr:outer membrane protein assembly factor BamB [Ramlibacter rhizophilus]TFZ03217.1 outer membrane protein assembly factor BamB [Ramlibacter rhizophilus]